VSDEYNDDDFDENESVVVDENEILNSTYLVENQQKD